MWIGESQFLDVILRRYNDEVVEEPLLPSTFDIQKTRLLILPVNKGNYHWMLAAIILPMAEHTPSVDATEGSNGGMILLLDSFDPQEGDKQDPRKKDLIDALSRFVYACVCCTTVTLCLLCA